MHRLAGVRVLVVLLVAMPWLATAAYAQTAVDAPKAGAGQARRGEAAEIWTDHLRIRVYPSEPAIAPGGRLSLIVEIEPGERMHVYAPGADDYRIVTLTVAAQPGLILAPVQYPPSEIYVFEPLDERIPVYQKPFKLVQEVMLRPRSDAQAVAGERRSLRVTGTLDYQACDDKICFNPVSVPLVWTIALRGGAAGGPQPAPR